MRIILATHSYYPSIGGVEEVVQSLARHLQSRGHEVNVLASRSENALAEEEVEGIQVHRYRMDAPWKPTLRELLAGTKNVVVGTSRVLSLFRRLQPEVVNLHFVAGGHALCTSLACRQARIPLVASIHGADVEYESTPPLAYPYSTRLALKHAAAVTSNSGYQTRFIEGIVPPGIPVAVIRNGVELERFQVGSDKREAFVLGVGRLEHKKGFDLLIRALALAVAQRPEIRLKIAGDGRERGQCIALARELGVMDQVEFLGWRNPPAVRELLRQCRFFVLPSRAEPLGLVNLEAMASGTAIIATRVGGVPEIVRDGENGILVAPESSEKIAQGLLRLWQDPDLCHKLGRAGRRLVEREYGWDRAAARFEQVFREAISSRRRGRTTSKAA